MSKYTKEDIIRMVREDDVEFIRMQFTDIFGQLKNVAITASQIEKAVNNEIMIDGSSIEGFVRINESDQYLRPDLDTFAILPWRPQHGKVACRPFFWARVLTASLKVMMLSAAVSASAYLKSISCCPAATS